MVFEIEAQLSHPKTSIAACGVGERDPQAQLCLSFDLEPAPSTAARLAAEPESPIPSEDVPVPIHFGEVLSRLEADPSRDRRHGEMKSAIRVMGQALRRPLQEVPTDPQAFRELIKGVAPASAGLTKERWSRIRSLAADSLRKTGCDLQPGRDVHGHSLAWKALAATLTSTSQQLGLSRFMSHCTRLGVGPADVTEATFDGFREALEKRSLQQKPDALYRSTVRIWNKAAKAVPGWPPIEPSLQRHPHFYSFDWTEFPAAFVADVDAFLNHTGSEDVFDADYVPAVSAGTTHLRKRQLRQLASLLVHGGFLIEGVTSLAVLTKVENATIALKHQQKRADGEIEVSLPQRAFLLKTVAKHWVKDPEAARQIGVLATRLNEKAPKRGMTSRNRERLRQFDLKPNTQALLQLPRRIFSEARCSKLGTPNEARRVMLALAIETLLVSPMRVANLCGLEPERHLIVTGRGKARNRHILIPGSEMKTNEDFEMVLPAESGKLLDIYVERYRPRICPDSSPYLFPTADGKKRNVTSFSSALSRFVKQETGLIMHAHLFRQLAGKLHLDAHPGDIETVRQVLGHARSATTSRYYVEERTAQAFRTYDATIAGLRGVWRAARPEAAR